MTTRGGAARSSEGGGGVLGGASGSNIRALIRLDGRAELPNRARARHERPRRGVALGEPPGRVGEGQVGHDEGPEDDPKTRSEALVRRRPRTMPDEARAGLEHVAPDRTPCLELPSDFSGDRSRGRRARGPRKNGRKRRFRTGARPCERRARPSRAWPRRGRLTVRRSPAGYFAHWCPSRRAARAGNAIGKRTTIHGRLDDRDEHESARETRDRVRGDAVRALM